MATKSIAFNPARDIPSLAGKIILVTGGNSGLGREMIKRLAQHGPAQIYLAARSRPKAEACIASLRQELQSTVAAPPSPPLPPITFLPLDLASLASVREAAASFARTSSRLDILINNAGVMLATPSTTDRGHEIHMGTNLLGPALLTQLLLPSLSRSPSPRVVFLSSELEAQAPASKEDYAARLSQTASPEGAAALAAQTGSIARYGLSKVATVHYAAALARRHPRVRVASVHPGVTATGLSGGFAGGMSPLVGWAVRLAFGMMSVSVEKGALNPLWAATAEPEGAVRSGGFFFPVGVEGKGSALARDEAASEVLWAWVQGQLDGHD